MNDRLANQRVLFLIKSNASCFNYYINCDFGYIPNEANVLISVIVILKDTSPLSK